MTCSNTVEVFVERFAEDWEPILRPCGSTGAYGELLLCDACEHTRIERLTNSDEPEDAGYTDN